MLEQRAGETGESQQSPRTVCNCRLFLLYIVSWHGQFPPRKPGAICDGVTARIMTGVTGTRVSLPPAESPYPLSARGDAEGETPAGRPPTVVNSGPQAGVSHTKHTPEVGRHS